MTLGWPFLNLPDADGTSYFVPPYSMLMKHHHLLANVKPSSQPLWSKDSPPENDIKLIATGDINIGQELFLDFASHPHSVLPNLFDRVPTQQDYEEADEVIVEERITFKVQSKKPVSKKRSPEVGMGLRMVQKAVSRYNPRVANLLPTMAKNLALYSLDGATTALDALSKPTHKSLAGLGGCLSDVLQPDAHISSPRKLEKGQTALPLPLYIREKASSCTGEEGDDSQTCTNQDPSDHCLGHIHSVLEICPLSKLGTFAATPEEANVIYQWSSIGDDSSMKPEKIRPEVVVEVRYF